MENKTDHRVLFKVYGFFSIFHVNVYLTILKRIPTFDLFTNAISIEPLNIQIELCDFQLFCSVMNTFVNDFRKKLRDFPHENHYFRKCAFVNLYFPILRNRIKFKLRTHIRRTCHEAACVRIV